MPIVLLLANAAATWFMTGLVWMVQVVHYPLFADVGRENYVVYQQRHMRLITWIVAPVMGIEAVTAIGLVMVGAGMLAWIGLGMVALLWLSTAVLQVPAHTVLSRAFDAAAHRRLVRGNWVRTILWTGRAGLVLWAAWAKMRGN